MQPSPTPHGIIHTAQQALRNTQQMNPMAAFSNNSGVSQERLKMLAGELYIPFSMDLEGDRNKCDKALYTFNNNNHANRTERMRHLRSVLSPEDSPIQRGPGQDSIRVGKGAAVDVPFRCEYGYNITLGSDVVIEGGCHISDPRDVHIGSGSYIGPGVKIMGKVLPFDPNVRGGAALEGKARGFEIHIGKNVHIGANSVIQPEEEMVLNGRLEIGDGAFIKPMSIVNKVCEVSGPSDALLTSRKSVPQYVIYGPRGPSGGPSCDVLSGIVIHHQGSDERKGRIMR
jgi:acetyltransferase-like isoleucine patch superfamily enzyme